MATHEPLLNSTLAQREQPVHDRGGFLDTQYLDTMAPRHFPDARRCKDALRNHGRHAVECIIDDPVKHLNQEGELLQQTTMPVVAEARGVGGVHYQAAAVAPILSERSLGRRVDVVGIVDGPEP